MQTLSLCDVVTPGDAQPSYPSRISGYAAFHSSELVSSHIFTFQSWAGELVSRLPQAPGPEPMEHTAVWSTLTGGAASAQHLLPLGGAGCATADNGPTTGSGTMGKRLRD